MSEQTKTRNEGKPMDVSIFWNSSFRELGKVTVNGKFVGSLYGTHFDAHSNTAYLWEARCNVSPWNTERTVCQALPLYSAIGVLWFSSINHTKYNVTHYVGDKKEMAANGSPPNFC